MTFMKFRPHEVRDFLIYTAVGLLVVAVIIGYAEYSARKGTEPDFKNDWSVATATAALVFGYAIRDRWRLRKMWSFWVSWLGLLIAHFAVLLRIFSRVERVPLLLIGVIGPLEIFIVLPVLDFVTGRFDSRHP